MACQMGLLVVTSYHRKVSSMPDGDTLRPGDAMRPDYLIVGSGLSALAFGALMARAGKRVTVLEAHSAPGEGTDFLLTFPKQTGNAGA